MIRKATHVDAPVAVVREVFRQTDAWAEWMPSVASTRTLAEDEAQRLVEVVILMFGRRRLQKLACRERDGSLIHRQTEGWFKKWEAVWSFRPPPEGQGTILSLALDFDLGVAGLLVPHRLLENWVAGLIDGTIAQGRRRAQRFARQDRGPAPAVAVGQPLLQIFETAGGFEIRFAGQTFHVEAKQLPDLDGSGG